METRHLIETTQGNMTFLSSMGNAMEHLVGRGARSITFRAGRATGMKRKVKHKEPDDLLAAIKAVQQEVYDFGMDWELEAYKKAADKDFISDDGENLIVKLAFRNCLVRSCQAIYGQPLKTSLCLVNHGVFCGLLQQVYGAFSDYEFIHSGENACIGVVKVRKKS
jgi:predicted hydrocarbon binding protein